MRLAGTDKLSNRRPVHGPYLLHSFPGLVFSPGKLPAFTGNYLHLYLKFLAA